MARRAKREAWRKLRAKTTIPEQLEALEMLHARLLEEVQAHGRASASFYRSALEEIGKVGLAIARVRRRQALESLEETE
ncbi:MAG: hypothetical protein V3V34_11720 [Kiloniellales bacterium]